MNPPSPKPKARPKPKNKPLKPESEAPVAAGGTGLRVGRAQAQPLSAAQKRFNKLLDSIDKFKAQIAEAQRLVDTYRVLYSDTLTPLQAQNNAAMRRMALLLDERLDERLERKGLSAAQKKSLIEVLCGLCELLAASGDDAMSASSSGRGPRVSALTATTVCDRSGICASTLVACNPALPANRLLAPLTCMDERSNTSSPASWVSAGQGNSPAGCRLRGTKA